MKPEVTIRSLGAIALGILLAAGPAAAQTGDAPAEAPAESATGAAEAPSESEGAVQVDAATVLATVGEREITLGELISLRRDLPEQYQYLPDEILSQGLLDQMIDQTLMAEAAREAGVDDRLDVALSIRNQIRAVLADAWLRAEVAERLTEERIAAAYDERHATAEPQEEVRAAHILVETEEKARELLAEIEGGADFAALAAEHGTDGTASSGGNLGWFVHGDMVPQFADAAFATEPGTVAGPVETPFGWHLIKVEERRVKPIPPLAEVRDTIAAELAQDIQTEIMDELRAGTTITLAEPPVPAAAIRADDLILPATEGEGN